MVFTLENEFKISSVMMGTYPFRNEAMDITVDAAIGVGYRGFGKAQNYPARRVKAIRWWEKALQK